MHFTDLNAKINHTINQRNRLYFSIYSGRDKNFYHTGKIMIHAPITLMILKA